MENVGLVFLGGGVCGIVYFGVIKVLEEYYICVRIVVGVSVGVIVGVFYVVGYFWEYIFDFFKNIFMFFWYNYIYCKLGFLDMDCFYDVFVVYLLDNDFQGLECKFYIFVIDICVGKNCIFSEGKLICKILVLVVFFIVFFLVQIKGVYYVDGGIINNFLVELLCDECDFIIGFYVNFLNIIEFKELMSLMVVMDCVFKIGMVSVLESKFLFCDLVIVLLELVYVGIFSFNCIDEVFEMGYVVVKKVLEEILVLQMEVF